MKRTIAQHGAASIPFVLGMGVLVLVIAVSITSVELVRGYLVQARSSGSQAGEYAQTGLRDGMFKIARDATFSIPDPGFYVIEMATSGCVNLTACVRVSVSSSTATTSDPKIVKSIGYYRAARVGLSARVVYDPQGRGGINIVSVTKF